MRKQRAMVRLYLAEHEAEWQKEKGVRRILARARLYWRASRHAAREMKQDARNLYLSPRLN